MVSIHAPVGVRPDLRTRARTGHSFNPRTRGGATDADDRFFVGSWFQSTHPWGCDGKLSTPRQSYSVSIHAPVGVRQTMRLYDCRFKPFQSTHPWGCDTPGSGTSPVCLGFNPRTRGGATRGPFYGLCRIWFQSTHPWGCDTHNPLRTINPLRFNPRTRGGATYLRRVSSRLSTVSIHAPVGVRQREGICVES